MGLLSDFFICDAESMASYGETDAFPNDDRCQYKYITSLEAGGLLAALLDSGNALQMMDGFDLQTPEDAEDWTMIVPQQMRTALLSLDDASVQAVASRCVSTIETLDYTQDDYQTLIIDLCRLAERAAKSGKEMYLWNSL